MIKSSKILIAESANKIWLSPTGEVVKVPEHHEHADVARSILGQDYDPDFEEDAFTEALQRGWIRMGSWGGQTYAMVMRLSRESLGLIQKFIMTNQEFHRSRMSLEQYEVMNGRNLSYYGPMDDFLTMNSPQEVLRPNKVLV